MLARAAVGEPLHRQRPRERRQRVGGARPGDLLEAGIRRVHLGQAAQLDQGVDGRVGQGAAGAEHDRGQPLAVDDERSWYGYASYGYADYYGDCYYYAD